MDDVEKSVYTLLENLEVDVDPVSQPQTELAVLVYSPEESSSVISDSSLDECSECTETVPGRPLAESDSDVRIASSSA